MRNEQELSFLIQHVKWIFLADLSPKYMQVNLVTRLFFYAEWVVVKMQQKPRRSGARHY